MRVDQFDFDLPEDRIALYPAEERDGSRLLHVGAAGLNDRHIKDLPTLLRAGDILVLNDTRVLPAQLTGERAARAEGGGGAVTIDCTLHKKITGSNDAARWLGFARPAKRLREGDVIDFGQGLTASVMGRHDAEVDLQFNVAEENFERALEAVGVPPLPPYIARKRPVGPEDLATYQTVYADEAGSVAAPTAGLHFTDDLLAAVEAKNVAVEKVTLHVGAGTFLPVSVDETADHKMHAEFGSISAESAARINEARKNGGRIIAVGTTSLRLLESAADDKGVVHPFSRETDIFITPGYRFKAVDMLLTNFHLPRSTLFMLVCALAGFEEMQHAYQHAIENEYRFYSYGDACLLERQS